MKKNTHVFQKEILRIKIASRFSLSMRNQYTQMPLLGPHWTAGV